MLRRLLSLLAVGLSVSLVACGGTETNVATTDTVEDRTDTVIERNLGYGTFEEQTLTLDLYVPSKPAGAPIVVAPSTAPSDVSPMLEVSEGLVDMGVIVFNVELGGSFGSAEEILSNRGAAIRAMAEQLACAIRFAREQASQLGSDDPTVVLAAFSTEGGLAAHAALFGATLEARWEEFGATNGPPRRVDCDATDGSTHVDALIGVAGAYDIFVPIYNGKWGRAYQQEEDPELAGFLSSSIGANPDLKVRLIHGRADNIAACSEWDNLGAALASIGYDVRTEFFDGGHEVPTDLAIATILNVIGP